MASKRGSSDGQMLDFDDEARALWARLNLDYDARNKGSWNPTDPIFCHPTGNGKIFVGNQTAAENLTYLRGIGVTHVVNCTHGFSKIPNFHEGRLAYFNFPISHWQTFVNSTNASVLGFLAPLFAFIDSAIAVGDSVLVHCLAGAHRAGTTGAACLIHYADMDVSTAIATAKKCRPIIDPIGQLPEFLHRMRRAYDSQGAKRGPKALDAPAGPDKGDTPAGPRVGGAAGGGGVGGGVSLTSERDEAADRDEGKGEGDGAAI